MREKSGRFTTKGYANGPSELLVELGWAESAGALYGSRHGREIRVAALRNPVGEEQEKLGVFVSRIRGEVFLTEADLAYLKEQETSLALVVAGKRAGFFVREPDGSIQTVRSHEEFPVAVEPPRRRLLPASAQTRKRIPAGAMAGFLTLAVLPLAALAVLPVRANSASQGFLASDLEVHDVGSQLRISWVPVQNGVLTVKDGEKRVSIPVDASQSSVTYAMQGDEVDVSLLGTDAENRTRRQSVVYLRAKPTP